MDIQQVQSDSTAGSVATLLEKHRIVHCDPAIMSGVPVFIVTRVPLQTLFDYLLSRKLKQPIIAAGYTVFNVDNMGWRGTKDRDLLALADAYPVQHSI